MGTTITTDRNTVYEATRYLAGRCDWAVSDDGVGFNQADTGLGHWLAVQADETWTDEMCRAAYDMLRKYARQLESAGIDYAAIPEPAAVEGDARRAAQGERSERNRAERERERKAAEKALRVIDAEGAGFTVRFPFSWDLVEKVKAIPGRRWDGAVNTLPLSAAGALRTLAADEDFTVTEAAAKLLEGAEAVEELPTHRIELDGGRFAFYYPKDPDLLEQVRAMPGRRWDADAVRWTVPADADAAEHVAKFVENNGRFTVSAEAKAKLDELAEAAAERTKVEAKLERAASAMEGRREIPLPGELALRPFQVAGVEYALMAKGTAAGARALGCFIADDMGTGKTWQSLIAVREADAFPCLVVVRSSIKRKWRDEVRTLLPDRAVVVLEGTKADSAAVAGADVIIINYDILAPWAGTVGKDYVKRGVRRREADKPGLLTKIGLRSLIVDESHYGKTPEALRTRALLAVAECLPGEGLVLNLTGTPVLNRPIELAAQLSIIGRLAEFGGYWKFAKRYCGAYQGTWGMDVSGSSNEKELHDRLRRTCFIRRTKDQVLPELPKIQVARLPMELDRAFAGEYREAENNVIRWVVEQVESDEDFMRSIADLDEESRKRAIAARKSEKAYRARAAEELVKLNALRRIAARGKLSTTIDWIEDFLESAEGEKLVVFAHHKDMQKALAEHFGALRIHADDDSEERHRNATKFQTDPEARVIVCSMEAAREGIDLFAASNVLFLEYGWNAKIHEQAEARCHRIGQVADSVTAWYTMAEGTIDEDMHALIEQKRRVADSITDGKEAVRDVSIQREIIDRLKRKAETRDFIAACARDEEY